MKTSKRILAVLMAVVLAFSVFAVSAFAVDGSMTYKVVADSTSYAAGDTVTVNVYLRNDYNATCLRFPVFYSADVFEVPATGVKLTAYDDCLTYKGSLEANTSNDESLYPLDYYDPSAYGCVLVQWTASVTSTNIGSFNSAESVKCFSFQLKVKSTAGGATGSIFIPEESNLFYNQAVIDSTDATTICRINTDFTFEGFDVEIEAGGVDGITTAAGSQVIIDHTNKVIKNWAGLTMSKATIQANVVALGDATLTFSSAALLKETGLWGTGSKVRVIANSTLTDYYILIYGDVDGDGSITVTDLSTSARTLGNLDVLDGIFATALDTNLSGDVDISDMSVMARHLSNMQSIDQTI